MSYSPKKISDFPAMFWCQRTGEYVVAKSEAEVPPGYKPYHPDSAPKDDAPATGASSAKAPGRGARGTRRTQEKSAAGPMRAEVVDELTKRDVPFSAEASDEDLLKLLEEDRALDNA